MEERELTEQEQQEYNNVMDAYGKAMQEYHDGVNAHNTPILESIKKEKGINFYNDLCEYMKDCECGGMFKIVTRPSGDKQKESYYGKIKFAWIDQRSVGDSGDSFEGTVTIQLDKNKYLEMPFSI